MKKITFKQEREINFLSAKFEPTLFPTSEDKYNYLDLVVKGIKKVNIGSNLNTSSIPVDLFLRKRRFEITLSMWKEDILGGTCFIWELREDYNHPYIDNIINSCLHPLKVEFWKNNNSLHIL